MMPQRIRRSKPDSLLPGFFSDDDFLVAGILLELPDLVLRECLPHKGVSSSSPSWGATKKRSACSGHLPPPSLHHSSSPDPVPNPTAASPPPASAAVSNAAAAPRNPSPPTESDVTDSNHSARSMNSPDPAREWSETVNGFTHCRGQPNGSAAKRRDPKAGKQEVCLLPDDAGARKRRPGIRRNKNAAVGLAKSMTPHPRGQQQASGFFHQLPSETAAASEDEGPRGAGHRYGHCETASFGLAVNHVEDPPSGGFDLNVPAWEAAAVECFHPSDVSGGFAVVDDPRARSKEARRRRVEIQRMKSQCLRNWPR